MRLRRCAKTEKILALARGITVYCLEDGFRGHVIAAKNTGTCCVQMVDIYKKMKRSYVSQNENGSFTFHIHSNLWYEISSYVGRK